MSYSGKFTPLQLNVVSALSNETGLAINTVATQYQGTWTTSSYTQGTVTSSTVLNLLTAKIRSIYSAVSASTTDITSTTYRSLISIGSGVCPALANTRPQSFAPTYAGYGSWVSGTLKSESYPPKNYPVSGAYSYVYQDHGEYAWVTGWPGRNSWQQAGDTYQACYLPSAGSPINTGNYDEYFSNGFIATVARQAYYEMWTTEFSQYNDIVTSFTQTANYKRQQNSIIASYVDSTLFMSGSYSNVNDLTTSDVAGVNQAFKVFGNDLINTGRAIDLSNISKFGLPSVLLRTLQRNNVMTAAVKLALMYSELTIQELDSILSSTYVPTPVQERKIYTAFTLVQGNDLSGESNGVLYGLNCTTSGLTSLADLLDPLKLFPNSCNSLTIPRYNIDTALSTSAKIYDFIYVNRGVNSRIQNWGYYLEGILSQNLVISCGAFAMTMQQIKYITGMNIERFSQVVANLELTNLNLPLINTGNGIAVDVTLSNSMLAKTALGSGNSGSYRQCDFYGSASGYPYNDYYAIVTMILNQLATPALTGIYANISALNISAAGANTSLQTLIAQANAEIASIYASNPSLAEELNYYWSKIGQQLSIEQRAIAMSITNTDDIGLQAANADITAFVNQCEQYAIDNDRGQSATTLSAISNVATVGGQSIVAMLREARNAGRMALTGGDLQNDVSSNIDICSASATATVVNGTITVVTVTNGSVGYTNSSPPKIFVYPLGQGANLVPVLATDGSIETITVVTGGQNYTTVSIVIEPPPQCQYANPQQQNYADTAYSRLVPPSLTTDTSASPTVTEAINDVIQCNCDCWLE